MFKPDRHVSFVLAEGEDLKDTLQKVGDKVKAEALRLVGLQSRT